MSSNMLLAPGMEQLSVGLVGGGPYGLRLTGGGTQQPLVVAKMHKRSKAKAAGVEIGDILLSINGVGCRHWSIDQAMEQINSTGPYSELKLHLLRGPPEMTSVGCVFESAVNSHKPLQTINTNDTWSSSSSTYLFNDQPTISPAGPSQRSTVTALPSVYFSSQLSTISNSNLPDVVAVDHADQCKHHISAVAFSSRKSFVTPAPVEEVSRMAVVDNQASVLKDPYDRTVQSIGVWNPERQIMSIDSQPVGPPPVEERPFSGAPTGGSSVWNNEQQISDYTKHQLGHGHEQTYSHQYASSQGQLGGGAEGEVQTMAVKEMGQRTFQPLIWRPSATTLLTVPSSSLDVPRPVSAPTFGRMQDQPCYMNGGGKLEQPTVDETCCSNHWSNETGNRFNDRRASAFDDGTEVVIWSSKVNERPHQVEPARYNGVSGPQSQGLPVDVTSQSCKPPWLQPLAVNHGTAPTPVSQSVSNNGYVPPHQQSSTFRPQFPLQSDDVPTTWSRPRVTETRYASPANYGVYNELNVDDINKDNVRSDSGPTSVPPPYFLTRVVVGGDEQDAVDDVINYGLKRKKMFADSSFYEDPEQKYPTIDEQIKMARQVARLLTSANPAAVAGRGQQMFLRRQQQSDEWTAESAPAIPHVRQLPRRSLPPEPPVRTPTSLEVLERLRLREAKTRHDVVPPSVFLRLADELQRTARSGETTAGRMFARRRERAEQSVVPEVPPPSRRLQPQIQVSRSESHRAPERHQQAAMPHHSTKPPQVLPVTQPDPFGGTTNNDDAPWVPRLKKMIDLPKPSMSPWEAAARYDGRVDPAFDHIRAYKAASAWTIAEPDDEEELRGFDEVSPTFGNDCYLSDPSQHQLPPRAQSACNFDHANVYRQSAMSNYSMLTTPGNTSGADWSRASTPGVMLSSSRAPPRGSSVYRPVQFHVPY